MEHFLILHSLDIYHLAILILGGIFAAFIGAVVGSDGFIYLMFANFVGIPANQNLLGSLKFFSITNAGYAIAKYNKEKTMITYKFLKFCLPIGIFLWIPAVYLGSVVGTKYTNQILSIFMPFFMLTIAVYKTFYKNQSRQLAKITKKQFFYIVLTVIFFYIGLLGPGSTTLIILAASAFRSYTHKSGSILARHVDLFGNAVAMIIFLSQKHFYIDLVILMTMAGIIGTNFGIKFLNKSNVVNLNRMLIFILYSASIYYFYQLIF